MKVIGLNGSPRPDGNTFLTINAFFEELHNDGIETELLHVADGSIAGCVCCRGCAGIGECVIKDEKLTALSAKLIEADGLFFAAPVYFGTMPGQFKAFLDRFMFPCIQVGKMRQKVGASAATLRRTGGYTTIDDLNRYIFSGEMISVGHAIIHGNLTGEVLQDVEGLSILKRVARNMAWVLKMKEATKESITPPPYEQRQRMNFIR